MTVPAEQQEVAAFLGGLSSGRSKETHISVVFIGEDTVWKLKKAVRLPFLDFSTLQARHRFLRRELGLEQTGGTWHLPRCRGRGPAVRRHVGALFGTRRCVGGGLGAADGAGAGRGFP